MLSFLVGKVQSGSIDMKATESADRNLAKGGPYKQECAEFTPLQLAIVSQHTNVNSVRVLFGAECNHFVFEASTGNNVLHLAAKNCSESIQVLEYVLKNSRLDMFARNTAGDTALTIVSLSKNSRAIEILEEC